MTIIADLFNVGILGYNVIDLCLKHLLPATVPSELDVERFYYLITLSGANIETQQRGIALVEKHLVRLEEVISQSSFSDRINKLILGIYESRANGWNPISPAELDKKQERAGGQLKEVNVRVAELCNVESVVNLSILSETARHLERAHTGNGSRLYDAIHRDEDLDQGNIGKHR